VQAVTGRGHSRRDPKDQAGGAGGVPTGFLFWRGRALKGRNTWPSVVPSFPYRYEVGMLRPALIGFTLVFQRGEISPTTNSRPYSELAFPDLCPCSAAEH